MARGLGSYQPAPGPQLAQAGLSRLLGLEALESACRRWQGLGTPAAFLRGAQSLENYRALLLAA